MIEPLVFAAPAKVNLYLAVGARRADGYHEVETVMQALELCDTVTLSPALSLAVTCRPDPVGDPDANIAAVAARALGEAVGREPAFAIDIVKRIPAGGGLGGGSADAAAVIAALARVWGLSPSDARVRRAAASVGADVPFFLEPGGCALLGGRGDELVRLLPAPRLSIVLVGPGVPVPTAAAYAAFDRAPQPAGDLATLLAAVERDDATAIAAALYDNLTVAAAEVAPAVADALAWVSARPGVIGSCVSGSGSTVFGICRDDAGARVVARAAVERGWWAAATRTRAGGVAPEDSRSGGCA